MVLAASFLLESLRYPVQASFLAADLRGQKNTLRMLHDARTHVHHPSEFASTGRLQDVPHPLKVDEKGFYIVLGRVLIPEVDGQIDDTIHAFQGAVDGVEVGYIRVDLFPLPVPIELPVHVPRFGIVVEGAYLVATGEIFQHRPADPPGGSNDCHFHNRSSAIGV